MLSGCFPPSSLVPTHSRLRDSRGGKVWRGAAFAGPTGSPQPNTPTVCHLLLPPPSLPRPPVHLITEASSCAAGASLRLSPPDLLRAPAARAVARLALLHLTDCVQSQNFEEGFALRPGRFAFVRFCLFHFIFFFFGEREARRWSTPAQGGRCQTCECLTGARAWSGWTPDKRSTPNLPPAETSSARSIMKN